MCCRDIEIGDAVEILSSGLIGKVVGIHLYMTDEPTFDVRYVDGSGTPVERAWKESCLTLVDGDDGGAAGVPAAPSNVILFPTRGPDAASGLIVASVH